MSDGDRKNPGNSGEEPNQKVFERIVENYDNLNKMMVEEMNLASEHGGLTGNYREEMWVKFFRSILPQKFSLAQGVIIIDSRGNVSKEVDIAAFDEQYTPYVFQYNTLKFIPIEAVALVIECKSTKPDNPELIEWAKSIDSLCTRSSGVTRMVDGYVTGLTNPTQKSTRPIKILACLKQTVQENSREKITEELGDHFDFIIKQTQEEKTDDTKFEVIIKNKCKPLGWWDESLNNAKNGPNTENGGDIKKNKEDEYLKIKSNSELTNKYQNYEELKFHKSSQNIFYLKNTLNDLKVNDNPLLSLNLQLNQLLMLLNNPMLFPHFAYAAIFEKMIKTNRKSGRGTAGMEGK